MGTETKTKIKTGSKNDDKPVVKPLLLDRYPKENRTDMEFPEHLSTFCFPNGYHPLKYKVRSTAPTTTGNTSSNNNKKSKKKQKKINIRYHHNVPESSLCT